MRVLVTGSAGFIGAHACHALLAHGHQVIPFDRPDDILDRQALWQATSGAGHVLHLAGVLGTSELFDSMPYAVTVNVGGTANVLLAARHAGAGYTGITMPAVFPSVYTATKTGARELEKACHHGFGMAVSRVRAFNAYGPGQKHGPGHPRKIVPSFATRAWAGEPIQIWGDGEQTVDLISAAQLGRLLADATAFGDDVTIDGGTGTAMTVNQVAAMVLDITGSAAGVEHLPMRQGEVPSKIAAEGEGWERLNWRPWFDEIEFARTVESYK